MEKIKQNKIWITIVVIGIIVIAILLAMLHQQKQNSPEAQSERRASSSMSSAKAYSEREAANERKFAKKAAKMKGHVFGNQFTTWTKTDFINWADNYVKKPIATNSSAVEKYSFGTSHDFLNNELGGSAHDTGFDSFAASIHKTRNVPHYYDTVTDWTKDNLGIDPSTIKK
ncbi:hypothetical protein CRI85_05065 [Leuconostoc pseudomesenteroides]|uniref:hypothetical protein n=1 Tax=Leuconostoc pseudomesenteroides TaxID=33968 RepID=UPI001E5D5505|nr:hypothetical protein [Leuconostoc pseudomesenteroides]MCC8439712.1 hypothetical protein [Leuconostoc pseudomesenteroides]